MSEENTESKKEEIPKICTFRGLKPEVFRRAHKKAKKQKINLSSFLEIRLVDYLNYKECSRRESNPYSWLERPERLVGLQNRKSMSTK